ncbi:MAG: tetratricopeptide repeat protein [Phycisphaerales bacterium]
MNTLLRPFAVSMLSSLVLAAAPSATAQSEPETPLPSLAYENAREAASPATVWSSPAFRQMMVESWLAESDIEPKTTTSESKRLQRIFDQLATEEPAKVADAESRLNDERGEKDSSAVFDFTLGQMLFQRDDLDGAKAAFEDAVRKFPKFRRAWRSIGVIEMRKEDYAKAIPALVKVIELGGGDSVTYGLLGFAFVNAGDDLAAENAFRMAVLLDPSNLDWRMQLVRSLFNQRRYADAAALCDKLIADNPSRGDLWMLQANAFLGMQQTMKAAENYELVDKLGQSTADSLNMLGDIYVNSGLFDLAVDAYGRAMKATPPSGADRSLRAANVMVLRGAYPEVSTLLDSMKAALGADMPEADRKTMLKLEARVAAAKGDGGNAVAVLEEIVSIDPLDGEALILLGQEFRRQKDPIKAAFAFERAAAIERFEAEAKLRHGQLLVAEGQYAEALPLLKRSQALKSNENLQKFIEQVERVARSSSGS